MTFLQNRTMAPRFSAGDYRVAGVRLDMSHLLHNNRLATVVSGGVVYDSGRLDAEGRGLSSADNVVNYSRRNTGTFS